MAVLWASAIVLYGLVPNTGPGAVLAELAVEGGGPRVIHQELAEPPLVSLRLSLPVEEVPGLAGATRVLQELARARLAADAAKLGARLELEHASGHAIYAVIGPRESFEGMVDLLRRALGRPTLEPGAIAIARARVEQRALAWLEVPGARVRLGLLAALDPTGTTAATSPLPDNLTANDLEWYWRRYFNPQRATVVVVGAVSREAALEAFRDWPTPPSPGSRPRSAAGERELPAAEAVSNWAAVGWSAVDEDPAVLAVASLLVTERLRNAGLSRAEAELWWNAGGVSFVAIGAVPRRPDGARLATTLRTAILDATTDITAQAVADARNTLIRRLLLAARTPQGLAELIGRFHDRTGEPDGAMRFLEAIGRVDAPRVAEALRKLQMRPPAMVELP